MESVSKDVISQLLDDLLDDRVLNDGERASILEKNKLRSDRARSLIDTVRRKGSESSEKMINHLQCRDPMLFSELGLSRDEPAAPGKQQSLQSLLPCAASRSTTF